ncbi:hypothetical protein [Roseospirillum parvum]|uniref:Uncharacterized protein n=1 Tax=Roseospirillum parvum TaxID=83401 RepID=A0A1G7W558_9PROT|nr:hypothetical protein [Roseospirillum parvum]SDG67142.1 hypothetical protein SAMN05421742_10284 [Roseospirillum parvum]
MSGNVIPYNTEDGELTKGSVVKESLTTASDGRRHRTKLADRAVLSHAGSVSHQQMLKIIDDRYATFDAARRTAEADTAEREHAQEVEAELKRLASTAAKAGRGKKPGGEE